ncbi:DUF7178 family protein [Pyruvatibacter sp.]
MADQNINRLTQALRNAHAAGDKEAARKLANALNQLRPSTDNPLMGATGRSADLGTGLSQFAQDMGRLISGEKGVSLGIPTGNSFGKDGNSTALQAAEDDLSGVSKNINYKQSTTWEDFKENPSVLGLLDYGIDAGITSAPDMVAALLSLPTYAAARTGEIANERAGNDEREDASVTDYAIAAPTAAASAALERVGAKGFLTATGKNLFTRFTGAAGKEAGTEFIQEFAEDAATTTGTEVGFDPLRAADRGLAGAVAGGVYGGTASGAKDVAVAAGRGGKAAVDYARDTQTRNAIRLDPDQAQSDRRVQRMFLDAKDASVSQNGGTQDVLEDHSVMKNVWHNVKHDVKMATKLLRDTDQLSSEQAADLTSVFNAAGNSLSELTEIDLDKIDELGLTPEVTSGFREAARDLNTISKDQKRVNATGPFTVAGRAVGAASGTALGTMYAGPLVGGPVGAGAGAAFGGKAGRKMDNLFGLSTVPSAQRRTRVEANARKQGLPEPGDTSAFLKNLRSDLADKRIVLDEQQAAARQERIARSSALNQRLIEQNHPGTEGNFWNTVWSRTGLKPQEAIKVVEGLREEGTVTEEEAQAFVENPRSLMEGRIGLQIMDLMDLKAAEMGVEADTKSARVSAGPDVPQGGSKDTPGIYSPTRYNEVVQQAKDAKADALKKAGDLNVANLNVWIEAVAQAKSRSGKRKIIESALRQLTPNDPATQRQVSEVLGPLAMFGTEDGPSTDVFPGSTASPVSNTSMVGDTFADEFKVLSPVIQDGLHATDGLPQAQNALGQSLPMSDGQTALPGNGEVKTVGFDGLPALTEKNPDRISSRVPTAKKGVQGDHTTGALVVSGNTMSPKQRDVAASIVKTYPGFSTKKRNPDQVIEEFKQHVTDNLLWLHDQMADLGIQDRAKLWYDGANEVAHGLSAEFAQGAPGSNYQPDIPPRAVAGVIAAMSPQKDWFQNVEMGKRVLDIAVNKQFSPWTDEMAATASRIYGKPAYKEAVERVTGNSLADLTDTRDKAMWVRIYDETYNSREYTATSPEGETLHVVTNKDGSPRKLAWGSNTEIEKAISVLEDPSPENISSQMGTRHKVRSFFNNIIDPKGGLGDVTIDTHAVAAGLLRPLSGNTVEVNHNFGTQPPAAKKPKGFKGTAGDASTGSQGLYGIYADAYRDAAAQRGVLPREMQSITWEAVRGLFEAKFKTADNVQKVDDIWKLYEKGELTLQEARQRITEIAGGITRPEWDTSDE